MLNGIDVSHWDYVDSPPASQEILIDWSQVSLTQKYCFMKGTEGANWVDHRFVQSRDGCLQYGIPWGAFHYYRTNASNQSQVDLFYNTCKETQYPPMIDIEGYYSEDLAEYRRLGQTGTSNLLRDMMERTAMKFGRKPVIYTGYGFWDGVVGNQSWVHSYFVWLAQYNQNISEPTLPLGFTTWDWWQYRADGLVNGIPTYCDMDYSRLDDQSQYIMNYTPPPPPPPPPPAIYPKVRVLANALNIRNRPSMYGTITGYLVRNDQPEKIEEIHDGRNIWCRIGWKQYAAKIYNGVTFLEDV